MVEKKLVSLRQMYSGQSGRVRQIDGGMGMVNRLNSLGIRPGKKITKVSSMLMRGPVTVQLDSTRLAIGFGMAHKIIVELEQ